MPWPYMMVFLLMLPSFFHGFLVGFMWFVFMCVFFLWFLGMFFCLNNFEWFCWFGSCFFSCGVYWFWLANDAKNSFFCLFSKHPLTGGTK